MNLSCPRQHKIAERLNIACTAAIQALDHDPICRVAPETRVLILKTAKGMGYTARRRRSRNIALIVADDMSLGYNMLHQRAAALNKPPFSVRTLPYLSYEEFKYYINPMAAAGEPLDGDYSASMIQRYAPMVYIDEYPCEVEIDLLYCS